MCNDHNPTNPAPTTRFVLGEPAATARVAVAEDDGHPVIALRAGLVDVDQELISLLNQLLGVDWTGTATAD